MTNHEPGRESVERCARAITGLRTLDEWTRSQVATEVLRCAVESCGYVPPGVVLKIGGDDADLPAAYWRERAERAERILAEVAMIVREECKDIDAAEYPDDLHLADVIEKYLCRSYRHDLREMTEKAEHTEAECLELRKERDRLRAALEEIYGCSDCGASIDIARDALEGK